MNLTLHDESNQNLTAGQKLLLHWHQRFGHLNLPAVQRIFRAVPFLSATFESASKCDMRMLKCETCEYAKGHRRAKQSTTAVPVADHVGALKVDHLKPGTQVSVDHFESRLLGRTFDSYGNASSDTYKGGCIFVDHGTGYMHVEHQLGFSAVETVRAKQNFELMAVGNGVLVESYLNDSGAFSAAKFVKQIRKHSQRIRYCGANAHHKNGVAKRGVQKVSNMARAMLLHSAAHWKDGIDSSLWPMAVSYATHLYNHLPNDQGLCPADLFTGSTVPRHRLRDLHVWGCPVYVLDPQLQAGQKLPRWQPRSRRGVFLGFSSQHSSEVPLVLNLQTGSITPQYHVVFDDHFSTVTSVAREEDPPGHWDELCLEHTTYIHTESSASDTIAYLEDDWLTPPERVIKERQLQRQDTVRRTYDPPVDQPPAITMPIHDINGNPVSPLKGAPAVPYRRERLLVRRERLPSLCRRRRRRSRLPLPLLRIRYRTFRHLSRRGLRILTFLRSSFLIQMCVALREALKGSFKLHTFAIKPFCRQLTVSLIPMATRLNWPISPSFLHVPTLGQWTSVILERMLPNNVEATLTIPHFSRL